MSGIRIIPVVLSIGKLAAGAEDYYLGAVARGAEEYYDDAGEVPGRWTGSGAHTLRLAGQVDDDVLRDPLAGLDPRSGEPLSATRRRVPGFDLTFSAPKSVSLLYAFGTPAVSAQVVETHEAALDAALGYLEREACTVRRGHAGAIEVTAGGFVAAAFRHRTSRAGDPQLHTHVLVANLGLGPDGRWSALRGRHLYTHARTAGFLYQAELRHGLAERLGIRWHAPARGMADIAGINPALIRCFSQRRVEIERSLADRGLDSPAAAQVATLATRTTKRPAVDDAALRAEWARRAAALGLRPEAVTATVGEPRRAAALNVDPPELAAALTAQHATFDRRAVVRAVAEQARDGATVADIEQAAQTFLATDQIAVLPGNRFTTREILELERRVIDGARGRLHDRVAQVDPATVEAALAAAPSLSGEQRALVRGLTRSGRGVEVIVGVPGSGKTHALATAHAAWTATRHTVIGAALAARAARQLEEGAGIPSSTIDRLLAELDQSRGALPDRCVIVVDESGMIGTRKTARLLDHARRANAKVVLVGDPHQLPEIEAGGAFAALARQLATITLTENHRQEDPTERRALEQLRAGQPAFAVRLLASHGRVTTAVDAAHARAAMVSDWLSARQRGEDAIMLASRRYQVDQLNHAARQALTETGAVDAIGIEVRGREFAVGDRVMTLGNWHRQGITNGSRGTIIHLDDERPTIAFDDGQLRVLPATYLRAGHLTHAYAMTIHKAQGATVDRTLVLADDALFREAGYTALSRGRRENRLYLVTDHESSDAAHHEPPEPSAPLEDLVRSLNDERSKTLAIDAIDTALALEL